MKHLILGLGLLGAILGLSLLVAGYVEKALPPVAENLEQAAELVQSGQWDRGLSRGGEARAQWERCRKLTSALAPHSTPEEIDEKFSLLAVYGRAGNPTAYAAVCRQLSQLLQALEDAQKLHWWNLL